MILESLFSIICNLIVGLFSGFEIIHLPLDTISTLYTILCYGVWVIGTDVMFLVTSSIVLWFTIKSTAGVAVWVLKFIV